MSHQLRNSTLLMLLFISGASSLIYESLWIRLLSLGVGSTAISLSLVLTFFFLGLSCGSSFIAKRVDKIARPLKLYSILEIGIAAYAAVLFFTLFHFHEVLAALPFQSHPWLGTTVKFALAGILMLPPAAAMGATLPLALQALERAGRTQNTVSLVYGVNTLGALFGAVTTGFLWIPLTGIDGTNAIAMVGNILVGAAGLFLARSENTQLSAPTNESKFSISARRDLPILVACAVCGFVSLSTEVIWSKYLGIFLGNNIYGLSIVLGLYLFGIGVGSLWVPFLLRLKISPTQLFIALGFGVAAAVGTTSRLLDTAPILAEAIAYFTGDRIELFAIRAAVSGGLLLIPTLLFGALFPLAIHLWSERAEKSNARVLGLAYAVNTVGGILGSFLTGILAMPLIGSANALRILVVMMSAASLFLVIRLDQNRRRQAFYGVLAVGLSLLFIAIQPFRFKNILKSAYPRTVAATNLKEALHPFTRGYEEFRLIVEGETSLISLSYDPKDGPQYRRYLRLKTNGLNESLYDSQEKDRLPRYEGLLGTLPYLFANETKSAFVVGYGGGYTVDLLTQTDLKKVEVVELEKAVLKAADFVHKGNNPLLKRKNLDLRVEDARFVLATKSQGPFDFIVSQPSHSWLSGVANLFTEEFFRSVSENLTEGGVFSQWLNLYNMDETVLKSLLKTFYTVFPYGAVFTHFSDSELILIGSRSPITLHPERLQALLDHRSTQRRLAGVPVRSIPELLSYYALSRDQAVELSKDAPLNTDRNAFAETRQSRLFYQKKQVLPQAVMQRAYQGDYNNLAVNFEDYSYGVLASLAEAGQFDKFKALLTRYEKLTPAIAKLLPEAAGRFANLFWRAGRYAETAQYGARAFHGLPNSAHLNLWLAGLNATREFDKVFALHRQHAKFSDRMTDCYVARAHLESGTEGKNPALFKKMENEIAPYTTACGDYFNRILGSYYLKAKRPDVASSFFEAYLTAHPEDTEAARQRAIAHLELGEIEKAHGILSEIPRS